MLGLAQPGHVGSDTAGLHPNGEALPDAEYHGSLLALDTHSVNVLLSKWLPTVLDQKHFQISSYCTQHRTGSVCEEIAKQWGLLPPSFCLANRLQYGDFWDDLKEAVRAVLTKYLDCRNPMDQAEHNEEDIRLCGFARALLEICHEARLSDNQDDDDEAIGHVSGIRRRRVEVKEFLDFHPPWTGVLIHPCPEGCCRDRSESIDRGTDLIMKVIFPYMTLPAANRYTKVFPVICRIG